MKLRNVLQRNNKQISDDFVQILIYGIKKVFPGLYFNKKRLGASDYEIVEYFTYFSLNEKDLNDVLIVCSKYMKLFHFS